MKNSHGETELYQISKVISITKLANGDTRHKTNRLELENEFILKNRNIYSEQNDLLKEAENPKDYDANFYLRLKHIKPIYRISDFLNYHFLNAQNKNLFLKHLEYEILGYFNPHKEQRRIDFINKWISEKKENETLPPQQTKNENETVRYTAKHYVLAYLLECNAKSESYPIGQKKELERIGSQRIGVGKGHRFYREFNNITNKYDINKLNHLIEIGGENWRTIVKDLSNDPETIETYLQSKQL